MTAELTRGQNHPLPADISGGGRLEVRVSTGKPVIAGATLGDEHGRVRGVEWVAHPGSPQLPGLEVSRQAAAENHLAVDLGAMPENVHWVNILLALPQVDGAPSRFGAIASPFVAITGLDGSEIATYTITDLNSESAVLAVELYRRQGAWKVRAVGQGYAGGLSDMLRDQGLPEAMELASSINEAVARGLARSVAAPPPRTEEGERVRRAATVGGNAAGSSAAPHPDPASTPATPAPATSTPATPAPASPQPGPATPAPAAAAGGTGPLNYQHPNRAPAPVAPVAGQDGSEPVAGNASGWTMEERLYNQVWGMFEDLARTTAAYRSAVDFAESRMEQELDKVLADPATRVGPAADAARGAARAKHGALVDQARAALDRDIAQLTAESNVVEPALPPAFAQWESAVWNGFKPSMETPMAVRLGDLHLPEQPQLRIPMLVRLPLERGLWIDAGRSPNTPMTVDSEQAKRLAMDTAVSLAVRMLAAYPAGEFNVNVIDPAGSGAAALAPLVRSGALKEPPAAGAEGVSAMISKLIQRVDLVQMAMRGGASDALPPHLDLSEQLLIVNDFPFGFDDRAVTQLRYLADEGPSVGVQLMMVADRDDARAYGPVLDPLWRALLRLTPTPDDHLADPWVGHAWTFCPLLPPTGSQVLQQVGERVASAREQFNR
ncbi:TerD family protein [Wenjunlia tyrosinilytica]|uniref:Export associated protein n=1 Tax=Wenjunlia tyrosinilytica TaxID=1544741 RepID=A0A918DRS5_9ACTN|nr:TerD family protein [Wenjunlia tyrosinilytica]GGO81477.1 export associated protein [Wenjunlia tyrosinilytica]